MSEFDPRAYWEQRLGERYSLDGVGWIGLGPGFNEWMYRIRRRVFLRVVRRAFALPSSLRVLDIGTGTGFYVDCWHEAGVPSVTGTDLTDTAVGRLRERYPADTFEQFDVGGDTLPFAPGSFDAISAMDVLFHIVDDARFARALENVATLLAPGGLFLFSDNFVHGGALRGEHQVSRPLDEIVGALHDAGLEAGDREPMFVLFNTPVDSGSRLLRTTWSFLTKVASRGDRLGWAVGAAGYPLERVLVSTVREGPSSELMVCRRRVAPAPASRSGADVGRSSAV